MTMSLAACSIATKRDNKRTDLPIPSTGDLPHKIALPDDGGGEGAEPLVAPNVKAPKIGIILGPGGARTYSYIGVLREFEKAKIPVAAISGVEWGALMAALYSENGKAHEMEWKASKIPDDFVKRGLLSADIKPFSDLDPYLKKMFLKTKIEDGKIPFSCITDNLKDFKSLMIFKGAYRDTLGFCMGHPPLTTSKNGWVSSSLQVKFLIDQMAQRGMDYIILVDSLTPAYPFTGIKVDESTIMIWSDINKSLNQNKKYVHQVITVPIYKNIMDFKSRKEFILQGEAIGREAVEKIIKQFDL